MYKLILFIVILFFQNLDSNGQSPSCLWSDAGIGVEDDRGSAICTDPYGNCYVLGQFSSDTLVLGSFTLLNDTTNTSTDIFLVKYDSTGIVVWAKSFGGYFNESGADISYDPNGALLVTGVFSSPSVAFGSFTLSNIGGNDVFVIKLDLSGNILWAKRGGSTSISTSVFSSAISVDDFGNAYLIGRFDSPSAVFGAVTLVNPSTANEGFLVKYDSNGNVVWAKNVGGLDGDSPTGVTVDPSGNCIITGVSYGGVFKVGTDTVPILTNTPRRNKIFLIKLWPTGSVIWAKNIPNGNDRPTDIVTDSIGNIFISGEWSSTSISFDSITLNNFGAQSIFLVKLDSNGNVQWAKGSIGNYYDYVNNLCVDTEGNTYLTGRFLSLTITFGSISLVNNSYTNSSDVYVAKFDTSGSVVWAKNAGGLYLDGGQGVSVNSMGYCFITGWFRSTSIDFGSCVSLNSDTSVLPGYSPNPDMFVVKLNNCVLPTVPTISKSSTPPFCAGTNLTLTSSSSSGNIWSNGDTARSITITASGIYFVSVTNSCGSVNSVSDTLTLIQPAVPIITSNGDSAFCFGDSVILTSTNATSYIWSNGATTQSISVDTSGSFSVMTTDINGCVAASSSISLSALPIPLVTISASSNNIDAGSSVNLTGNGGNTYTWQPGNFQGGLISVQPCYTTDYFLEATDSNGCIGQSSQTISVNPMILTGPQSQFASSGSDVQFNIISSCLSCGYQWQTNSGSGWQNIFNSIQYSGVFDDTLSITNVLSNLNNSSFRCIVNSGGCIDTSSVATLTVQTLTQLQYIKSGLIKLYPNPAEDFIAIEIPNSLLGSSFTIINNLGNVILSGRFIELKHLLSLTDFPCGNYYLRLENEQSIIFERISK